MEPTGAVSAVSAALTSTVKITEKVFEIRAVDKQARSLLETINEVNGQLDVARNLRRRQSGLLSAVEKKMMDSTFQSTERAVSDVAKLVEPCRVAMETSGGEVGLGTRLIFVLRDSPNIQVSQTRLRLASQSLHTALIVLCSRDAAQQTPTLGSAPAMKSPPSYEESQFLTASRARNMLRKASSDISSDDGRDYRRQNRRGVLARLAEDVEETSSNASTERQNRRTSRSSRHELFFDEGIEARPRAASTQSVPFLPYLLYRPGPPSISSASFQSDSCVPAMLRVGSSESVPAGVNQFPQISEWRAHANTEMYGRGIHIPPNEPDPAVSKALSVHDDTATVSDITEDDRDTGMGWKPTRASWDIAHSRPAHKSASWSGLRRSSRTARRSAAPRATEHSASDSPLATSTFAIPQDSDDPAPHPLFSKMVKLESGAQADGAIRRVKGSILRKPIAAADKKDFLDSEFPEVVPEPGLELALPYPLRDGSVSRPAMLHSPSISIAERISLVTEVATTMMEAARQHRSDRTRDVHEAARRGSGSHQPASHNPATLADDASGLIPLSELHFTEPSDIRRWSDNTPLRSATVSPAPSLSSAPLGSSPLTGRARSQRWREVQFEKFEQLQSSQTN